MRARKKKKTPNTNKIKQQQQQLQPQKSFACKHSPSDKSNEQNWNAHNFRRRNDYLCSVEKREEFFLFSPLSWSVYLWSTKLVRFVVAARHWQWVATGKGSKYSFFFAFTHFYRVPISDMPIHSSGPSV